MTIDPALIAALQAALAADPGQLPVRRHLAGLLLTAGRAAEALAEARLVLASEPADREAMAVAATAAEAVGDGAAAGFRQLLAALGGPPEAAPREAPEPRSPTDSPVPPRETPPSGDEPSRRVQLRLVRGDDLGSDELTEEAEEPTVTLADVAGLEAVKRRIELAFLAPLRNPELGRLYRKTMRGGLLLYGPPGCGKTFLARALAGELRAKFFSVGLSQVLDMWLGQSEKNLHELFETARRQAPSVLFVDEIDALGRKRSLMRHAAAMSTVVNQFLAEMDGMEGRNDGLFVLAATNQPWDVDPALRRPGRLDRTILVLPPDRPARTAILAYHLRDRPAGEVDLAAIAGRTEDYSGADLAHLVEVATELALEDSLASGTPRPITDQDLKRALKEVRPSIRPWLESARNFALFANEGGVYDDLVVYLRERRLV